MGASEQKGLISMGEEMNARINALATRIIARERPALARGITLVESQKLDDEVMSVGLCQQLLGQTGKAMRVGITGFPGAGKSTLIDNLGKYLISKGHRVAVLAIDPSSQRTGGSILGDKTRMPYLSVSKDAFVRPSPAGKTLGGVARRTQETMLLCEAAGFDVILVETVGVGQSEVGVVDMVDCLVALMISGAGDTLQGIKKGVLEVADILVVNKADGDNKEAAKRAALEYRQALAILHIPAGGGDTQTWQRSVLTCSGFYNEGLEDLWAKVVEHRSWLENSGEFTTKRAQQHLTALEISLQEQVLKQFFIKEDAMAKFKSIREQVQSGAVLPRRGAIELLGG